MSRAVLVATGPSLARADCDLIKNAPWPIYAVNDAYRCFSLADIIYACDGEWWDVHEQATRGRGTRWTTNDEAAARYGLRHIPGHYEDGGFDSSGQGIVYGGNSGFQALNLAWIHGVREAILVGYDMGHSHDRPRHFFGEHPQSIDKPSPYNHWIEHFRKAAPKIAAAGMRVLNASRWTRLDCFPRVKLEDVL